MSKIEELTKWFEEYGVLIPDGSKATIKDFMAGCEIEIMAEELYEDFIADLQHQLKVSEMATKLACKKVKYFEEMQDKEMGFKDFFGYESNYDLQAIIEQYKEQAEKEIKGE